MTGSRQPGRIAVQTHLQGISHPLLLNASSMFGCRLKPLNLSSMLLSRSIRLLSNNGSGGWSGSQMKLQAATWDHRQCAETRVSDPPWNAGRD